MGSQKVARGKSSRFILRKDRHNSAGLVCCRSAERMVKTVRIGWIVRLIAKFYNRVEHTANPKVCEKDRIGGEYPSQTAFECVQMRLDEFGCTERIEQTPADSRFEGFLRLLDTGFARLVQSSARVC